MTDVLFTHSYFLRFDPKQWKMGKPYPPLATLFAASKLRQDGVSVALHDVMFASAASEIKAALSKHKPKLLVICDDNFNYLSKMCLTNMREAAWEMARLGKDAGALVVLATPDASDHPQDYLKNAADLIILGEVEETLSELCSVVLGGKSDFSDIPGLAYLSEGNYFKTARRENLKDLDSLPLPAWDLVDIEAYRKTWIRSSGYFSLNMVTTRGCPFKCNWCAKPVYGNRYNSRSPENVIAELKLLQQFKFDHIWFSDDIFGLKPGWVHRFAELCKQEGLKFRFKIQSRVDLLLEFGKSSKNVVEALAEAGCEEVWVGAESGSQKILDAMDKGTKIEQIYEATRHMKANGIKPCFFLQFGYPGEELADIRATIEMLEILKPHDIGISVSYPLPGTPFFERVKAELGEKANWKDSDELLLMYRSTYPPEFYKKLQRYVHRTFRKQQAFASLRKLIGSPAAANSADWKKALSISWRIPQSLIARQKMKDYAGF